MHDFQLGDVVQQNSGGPLMTIDHIGPQRQGMERDAALCSWFIKVKGNWDKKNDWFELHSIRKADPVGGESSLYPGSSVMG